MSGNHSDGEENLFNVASLLNLDKQLLQGSLAKFIVGFDPKAPLPGLFDDGISKAAPIHQLGGKGVDVPVLGNLIHKAGMQDVDVSSANFKPDGGHAHGGHGGGVGL